MSGIEQFNLTYSLYDYEQTLLGLKYTRSSLESKLQNLIDAWVEDECNHIEGNPTYNTAEMAEGESA